MIKKEDINSNKKLKVCHVITGDLWGGAEAQVYELIREACTKNCIEIRVILFNKQELYKKLYIENVSVSVIKESENSILDILIYIFRELNRYRPDIVHCHGYKENILSGIAAKILKIKLVRTHHGSGLLANSYKHRLIEYINDVFLTTKQISVSNNLKDLLIHHGISESKIAVVHNGIVLKKNKHRVNVSELLMKMGIDNTSSPIIIGTAARLTSIKGQKYLIEACKILLDKGCNIILLIVGDGPLFNEYERYIKEQNISKSVRLLGFRENVLDYVSIMDIFVLSSLHEGIPMAILEAMTLSKAIVSTEVGGIPEMIENEKEGLLVPSKNSDAISKALYRLIKEVDLREVLGRNAERRVIQDFTIEKTFDDTYREYVSLLES